MLIEMGSILRDATEKGYGEAAPNVLMAKA